MPKVRLSFKRWATVWHMALTKAVAVAWGFLSSSSPSVASAGWTLCPSWQLLGLHHVCLLPPGHRKSSSWPHHPSTTHKLPPITRHSPGQCSSPVPVRLPRFGCPEGISCWLLLITPLVDLSVYAEIKEAQQGLPFLNPHLRWDGLCLEEMSSNYLVPWVGQLLSPAWPPEPSDPVLSFQTPFSCLWAPCHSPCGVSSALQPSPNTLPSSTSAFFLCLGSRFFFYIYNTISKRKKYIYGTNNLHICLFSAKLTPLHKLN